MLPRKFCLRLALFIIANTRRNLALLYLRSTVIILQAEQLRLNKNNFYIWARRSKGKGNPDFTHLFYIYSDFTTNLSFMVQSKTRQSFMSRSCAFLHLKCTITLTGNQRHMKSLQFHGRYRGWKQVQFFKGVNPVQNPAELGNKWTGELEFPDWRVRFLHLHPLNVSHM